MHASCQTIAGRSGSQVEPAAYLVVDAVHGSALSGGGAADGGDERLRLWFEAGLEIVIAALAATAHS